MSNIFVKLLVFFSFVLISNARIHHLSLLDDNREEVTMSTYGFLKNGILQVNVKKLEFNPLIKLESIRNSFAFILEKTTNNGFSSFTANPKKQDYCSIIKKKTNSSNLADASTFIKNEELNTGEHDYSLIIFHIDLVDKHVELMRFGSDLRNLRIQSKFTSPYGLPLDPITTTPQIITTISSTTTPSTTTSIDANENEIIPNDSRNLKNESIDLNFGTTQSNVEINKDFERNPMSIRKEDIYDPNSFMTNELSQEKYINFTIINSSLSFRFQVNIRQPHEEGLYILSFFNCFQPQESRMSANDLSLNNKRNRERQFPEDEIINSNNYFNYYNSINEIKYGVNLELDLLERNEDSFLSAGEIPMPTFYLTWSIIYFLAGISWMYILRASKGDVYKIHYLMMALVFIKSISLTFHAINMYYIAVNGRHEAVWAILYYITYVLRGLLLIISILLVGTGWTFIKHILSENERRLFVIVIPLQILAITAYIFLEEKEEGDAVYVTWRQLFFLVDLLCCGAILFPVVWSIRHLEAASRTDGKMVTNLRKLKIFKHFYIMVIFYVYFTRIIGFLLKQMLPFRYEWFDELSIEVVTFGFFAMTAYKFQPTSNNPYLQLSQEDENSLCEMQLMEDPTLNGNVETVLDLIEHDYSDNNNDNKNKNASNGLLLPSGPDSNNPTLFSRKQVSNNSDDL